MGARLYLGALLAESGRTDEALSYLQVVADEPNPLQRKAIVAMARVHQLRREFDRAGKLLDAYVQDLDDDERKLYYDLSLVADGEELEAFKAAPESEWKALSEAFWASRDPAPVTAVNERLIEHRRRVAYAREHYGEDQYPWDDRGEVYIRYGEPDHRSASSDIRFETDPKVVAVKERLMLMAGDAVGALAQARAGAIGNEVVGPEGGQAIGSASTIRRQIAETGGYVTMDGMGNVSVSRAGGAGTAGPTGPRINDDSRALSGVGAILGWPVYPVEDQRWEYWIYTDVGPGVEVTFTQPNHPGPFLYAEPPHGIGGSDRRIELAWQRLNPRVVMDGVAAATPEHYRPDFASGVLDFYHDSARFHGENGLSALEVYFGIPVNGLTFTPAGGNRFVARVARGIAVYSDSGHPVHRASDSQDLYSVGPPDSSQLAFVPALDRVSLQPGTYRVDLQVLDTQSDRSQVYSRLVTLDPAATDSLAISDVQMASVIRPTNRGRFRKGDVSVVPNPTRHYLAGQPVYLYYEVYNLEKDDFGITRYRVSYEVRSAASQRLGVRVLNALGRMLGQRRERQAVVIEYAHTGERSDEPGYIQLDMSNTTPGEQEATVRVTDEVSGQTVEATARFGIR
jgi:GWxTD domain-containing protein